MEGLRRERKMKEPWIFHPDDPGSGDLSPRWAACQPLQAASAVSPSAAATATRLYEA